MGKIRLTGATSGYTELQAASAAGNNTITLPTTDGGQVIVSDSSGNVNIDSGTFYVDASNNRVGIGTTSPGSFGYFAVRGFAALGGSYGNVSAHFSDGVTNSLFIKHAAGEIGHFTDGATAQSFYTNSTERARIDSSGRLLVGTSTARSNFNNTTDTTRLQIEGTDAATSSLSLVCNNGGGVPVASIHLAKSDGASIGSTGAVANNWDLGDIRFSGSDGTEFVQAASIACEVDGTPGTNDMPGRLVFSTTADGASSPTERMRITQAGDAFIGDTSAQGVTSARVVTGERIVNVNSDAIADQSASLMARQANSANEGTANSCILAYYRDALAISPGAFFKGYRGSAATNGTIRIKINSDGNITNSNNSYGSLSDIKLKENIVDASSQWNDIKNLRVRNYNFKEETGQQTHRQIGLIAQETELVSPGLVTDIFEANNEVTKTINYSVLYMKAVKALQEAMERIEQLETEMAAVKAQLS